MKLHTIATLGMIALILTTGSALALPGNAPGDPVPADEHSNATTAIPFQNAYAADSPSTSETNDATGLDSPATELPDPVPDHVTELHETIRSFLDDQLNQPLGHALSDLLGTSHPTETPDAGS